MLRTYLVALLLALVSGLLFGMVPVRQVLKVRRLPGHQERRLRRGGQPALHLARSALGRTDCRLRGAGDSSLVAARGMVRSLHSNFGFVPQNAMQVSTDLDMAGYTGDQVPVMQRRMLDAVAAIPGVTAAGYSDSIPLNLGWSEHTVFADSTTDFRSSNAAAHPMDYSVSPGYFHAAGTTLLQGREFTWDDKQGAPWVAVVNREFARVLFGSETNAIDNSFKFGDGTRVQVVGIVEDGKYKTLSEEPQPAMFLSMLQSPSSSTCG